MSHYTVGYWNTRAIGEPIRLVLACNAKTWEDKRYQVGPPPTYCKAEWNNTKENLKLDFPNLPYLIVQTASNNSTSTLRLTQMHAIMHYLGEKFNLLGTTPEERARVVMILEASKDWMNTFFDVTYCNAPWLPNQEAQVHLSNPEQCAVTSSKFQRLTTEYLSNTLPKHLQRFVQLLSSNDSTEKPWIANTTTPTIADYVLYEYLDQHLIFQKDCLPSILQEYHGRFQSLKLVQQYLTSCTSNRYQAEPLHNRYSHFHRGWVAPNEHDAEASHMVTMVDTCFGSHKDRSIKYNPNMSAWQKTWSQRCSRLCCFAENCGDIKCNFCKKSMLHETFTRYFCLDCLHIATMKAENKNYSIDDDFHEGDGFRPSGFDLCLECYNGELAHCGEDGKEHCRWLCIDKETGEHQGMLRPVPKGSILTSLSVKDLTPITLSSSSGDGKGDTTCSSNGSSNGETKTESDPNVDKAVAALMDGQKDNSIRMLLKKECKLSMGAAQKVLRQAKQKVKKETNKNELKLKDCASCWEKLESGGFWLPGCQNPLLHGQTPFCSTCLLDVKLKDAKFRQVGDTISMPPASFYCAPPLVNISQPSCGRDKEEAGIRSEFIDLRHRYAQLMKDELFIDVQTSALSLLLACPSLRALEDENHVVRVHLNNEIGKYLKFTSTVEMDLKIEHIVVWFKQVMKLVHPQKHLMDLVDTF